MKKAIFFLVLSVFFFESNAQFQKGAVMIADNVILYGGKTNPNPISPYSPDLTNRSFNVINKTQISWFVSNNAQIGFAFAFEHYFTKNTYQNTSITTKRAAYFFNSYYTNYFKVNEKLFITTTGNLLIGPGTYRNKYVQNDIYQKYQYNSFNIQINITPGIAYMISNNLAISATIGQIYYRFGLEKPKTSSSLLENKNENSTYGIDISPKTLSVGINFFLGNSE